MGGEHLLERRFQSPTGERVTFTARAGAKRVVIDSREGRRYVAPDKADQIMREMRGRGWFEIGGLGHSHLEVQSIHSARTRRAGYKVLQHPGSKTWYVTLHGATQNSGFKTKGAAMRWAKNAFDDAQGRPGAGRVA